MKRINLSLTSLLYAAIVLCSLRPLYLNAQQNDSIPPLEWGVTYGGPAYTSPWDMEVDKL